MAGTGLSKKALKQTRQSIGQELKRYAQAIQKLRNDVERMNRDIWYGGQTANNWYQGMQKHYEADVKYGNKMKNLHKNLSKKIEMLDSKTTSSKSSINQYGTTVQTLEKEQWGDWAF